jgi:hypothetical protein
MASKKEKYMGTLWTPDRHTSYQLSPIITYPSYGAQREALDCPARGP